MTGVRLSYTGWEVGEKVEEEDEEEEEEEEDEDMFRSVFLELIES